MVLHATKGDALTASNLTSISEPPQAEHKTSHKHHPFWYGGLASTVAGVCTHPLDLAKVRLQTAHQRGQNMFGMLVSIIKNEGPLAIFSGVSASILRQGTYSTMRFGVYEYLKESTKNADGSNPPLWKLMPISMFAGVCGGIVGNPADICNIRMQNDKTLAPELRKNYRNAFDGIYKIFINEGPAALMRGAGPNCARAALMTASQAVSYDEIKEQLIHRVGLDKTKQSTHFTASLLAGLVATTICSPVDVVKTRIMGSHTAHEGAVGIFVDCVKKEGPMFMFRGWLPSFMRLGPQTIITFVVLEQLKSSGIGQ